MTIKPGDIIGMIYGAPGPDVTHLLVMAVKERWPTEQACQYCGGKGDIPRAGVMIVFYVPCDLCKGTGKQPSKTVKQSQER